VYYHRLWCPQANLRRWD